MKKSVIVVLCICLCITMCFKPIVAAEPEISAQAAIVMEASTGRVIYEKNADDILHPASITKIMTLILVFDAIKDGQFGLEDEVTVSEHAASMGGSQVFLEAGEKQTVNTMIKCISMASANDACVAMAEFVSGTEAQFVEKMNERAGQLGMSNTHFVNCCGLDEDTHLTTARDVALMSRELITKYPEIHNYSSVWMDTITHSTKRGDSEFVLTNTNKLIKQYEWATGLKTGSTSKAKCCLSATANKDGIELIAVVMASDNGKKRFADAQQLLDYGYGLCQLYSDADAPQLTNIAVDNGKNIDVKLKYSSEFKYLFLEKYAKDSIQKVVELPESVPAPVSENQKVGELQYYYNGELLGNVDIIACENVEKAEFIDVAGNVFSLWSLLK